MRFSLRNSRLASVGLASIIAVGAVGFGSVAMAEGGNGDSQPPAESGARRHHHIKLGVENLLKDSGVTRDELKQGAQDGLTLAGIIDQYGDISAAQAKQNALDALSARLDEAVANGELTQDQADRIEAAAPGMLDRLLAAIPGSHIPPRHLPGRIVKNALETVADVLNLDVATLRQDLKDGQTIAGIAGAQTQEVMDALTAQANAAIEKAVADGKLPPEKEDAAKEKAAAAIDRFVNETHTRPNAGGNDGNTGRLPRRAPGSSGAPGAQ